MASRACAELSPLALKMLLTLAGQLRAREPFDCRQRLRDLRL